MKLFWYALQENVPLLETEPSINPYGVSYRQIRPTQLEKTPHELDPAKHDRLLRMNCFFTAEGYRSHSPKSCRHYYECENKQPIERVCQDGYAFNEDSQNCDPESEVNCLLCPMVDGHIWFYDTRAYNQFYICDSGIRYKFVCPSGERYDRLNRQCKPRAEVQWDVADICFYRNSSATNFVVSDPNKCQE